MPPPRDFGGLPTTLPAEAVEHWDATVQGFLAHAAVTPEHLGRTLQAAPDFAQGHAARGLFCLLLGRREMTATAREGAYLQALEDWLAGQPSTAAARLEGVLAEHPRDALAMKLVQAIRFVLGEPRAMRASAEAVLPTWDDHPALGYLKGCHAFALEETGEYAAAEAAGRAGLALAADDAWGLHAVAHVYDMTGRPQAGLSWLSGREGAWAHCNNFRFHVWWHIALMELDLGHYDAALALYDDRVRAEPTDDYRDIANAASLLARLEIEGVTVGDRWEELSRLAEGRTVDGCLTFADLHYMLALIGGGRDEAAGRLLSRIARDAARAESEIDRVMERPGLSAAAGLEAWGEGRHAAAFLNLSAARRDMQRIGGSHAQRDIFERLTIESALRAGYLARAERMLAERAAFRGGPDGYHERRMALIAAARGGCPEADGLRA